MWELEVAYIVNATALAYDRKKKKVKATFETLLIWSLTHT